MISKRKSAANRKNATRSTGPRTAEGKARASQNAYKHGLAVGILNDAVISTEVERLARRIAGNRGGSKEFAAARVIAEAEFALLRVRAARTKALEAMATAHGLEIPRSDPALHALLQALPCLEAFDRYERRAFARRRRAVQEMYASSF
jgi:hypothetical protein